MTNAGEINRWKRKLADSQRGSKENHYDKSCGYQQRGPILLRLNRTHEIYVLIRICNCKKSYTSNKDLLETKLTQQTELGDGTEIHVDKRCCYRSTEIQRPLRGWKCRHEKLCFCPKDCPFTE